MKRSLSVLFNPVLLSLWATLLVLLVFPVRIDKYALISKERGTYMNDQVIQYDDLDQDGTSERINFFSNSLGSAGLTVSNAFGVLDQWTFRGTYGFVQVPGIVMTGDRDGNGIKEIYVFTLSGDSVLLHSIPDFRNARKVTRDRFIAKVARRNGKIDPYMIPAEMEDLTGDGSRELIFGIGTGYSLYPRRVYAWDMMQDTLLVSPESGYFINRIMQEDVDGDQIKEIIPYGYAASNVQDSTVPFPDFNSWLMVLNDKLLFAFEPLEFPGQYSNLTPAVLSDGLHRPVLAALYRPPENLGDSNILIRLDARGRITGRRSVTGNTHTVISLKNNKGEAGLLTWRNKEGFDLYDTSLIRRKSVPSGKAGTLSLFDADQDGHQEVILSDLQGKQVTIYRSELDHPVSLSLEGESEKGMVYSILKGNGDSPALYLQLGNHYSLFFYGRNPSYKFRFFIQAAIYLSILLFTLLVRKFQLDQLRRKQETEKKIADLQLQIVRNQLDPHFIMNAVNSIIISITDHGKEDAKKQLLHFSHLHRSLLMSSDQILRSLKEELEFTENYLALEKFRFRDKFEYTLRVDPAVDLNIQVPKMILQIHAENALKHGIMPVDRKGMLDIGIHRAEDNLVLQISDNGAGREFAKVHGRGSTGKGLAVMEDYITLFNKYHPGKISTEIIDLHDKTGNPAGTRIIIKISNKNERHQK